MRKIAGLRAGRPDYSFTSTMPIAPPAPAGIQQLYWNGKEDVPPGVKLSGVPVDPFGKSFPRANKILKLRKFVASTEADTLIGVDLIHVSYEGWVKYKKGEITFDEMLEKYGYSFAREYDYQRVEIRPELYTIPHPDVFMFVLDNVDTANAHTIYLYWNGEEHAKT